MNLLRNVFRYPIFCPNIYGRSKRSDIYLAGRAEKFVYARVIIVRKLPLSKLEMTFVSKDFKRQDSVKLSKIVAIEQRDDIRSGKEARNVLRQDSILIR